MKQLDWKNKTEQGRMIRWSQEVKWSVWLMLKKSESERRDSWSAGGKGHAGINWAHTTRDCPQIALRVTLSLIKRWWYWAASVKSPSLQHPSGHEERSDPDRC